MDAILERYLDFQIRFVPLRAEATRANRAKLKDLHLKATARLFLEPYDERWVTTVEERCQVEKSLGFGMRARPILNRAILSGMIDCIARRHRLSVRKVARLSDVACRVLTLDIANALANHTAVEIDGAAMQNREIAQALESFATIMSGVQHSMADVAVSLDETSRKLNEAADKASTQAHNASAAASRATLDISGTASSTE
jgi:hypothetical protein